MTSTKPTRQELYEAAKGYLARWRWSILPIRFDKKPALKAWKEYQKQRPTDAQLRQWFVEGKGIIGEVVGLAVVCGEISGGTVVRDYDKIDAYTRWAGKYPELARALPTVETARGRHVYFVNGLRRIVEFPDGELRGAGYVCLPPTLHPSGKVYAWLHPLPAAGPLPTISDPAAVGLAGDNGSLAVLLTNKQRPQKQVVKLGDLLKPLARELRISEDPGARGESVCVGESPPPSPLPLDNLDNLVNLVNLGMQDGARLGMQGGAPLGMQDGARLGMQGGAPLGMQDENSPQNSRIEKAIRATLPRSAGQRHKRLFIFAGKCRAIGGPDAKAGDFKAAVKQWHTRAFSIIGTKEFSESWADFCASFQGVKNPREGSDLADLLATADREALPACASEYVDTPALCRLVRLCRALQGAAGAGVAFYLSQGAAGAALGVDQASVSRYLSALLADGILCRTYAGHTGRASEYVFTGELAEGGG